MIVVNRRRKGIDNTWSSRISHELRCIDWRELGAMVACYAMTIGLGVLALVIAGFFA